MSLIREESNLLGHKRGHHVQVNIKKDILCKELGQGNIGKLPDMILALKPRHVQKGL